MLTQDVFLSKARCAIKIKKRSIIDVWAADTTQSLQNIPTGGWSSNKNGINRVNLFTLLPSEFTMFMQVCVLAKAELPSQTFFQL